MFEITSDDIAALGDADLRTLIGLLCEAEMRKRGQSPAHVTYGGNQDAPDGGLDVRVALPAGRSIEGFVPKAQTGFQTKKPDMPRAEILEEMKPGGILRPVLLELAAVDGAYIIVSSTGSVADAPLERRRAAMAEALVGTAAEGRLHLDFYDRSRVATWVRDHPGLIAWVRARIGKAVAGWQSFGPWAATPAAVEQTYIVDDHARIRSRHTKDGEAVPAVEGINQIRAVLAKPGQVVRLVGLSGVGKTRLAEALFDDTIGTGALDPAKAIYCNEADGPDPAPVGLASDLVANGTRAVLVIDNCPPELHRRLSEVARSGSAAISVLSIEYDIREDQPEGTDVFELETSSTDLIEKLVQRRYGHLSQTDARTLAEFSGGNARVALALASRIEATESVAGLGDEELFNRLFVQRRDRDPALLGIAQACSLVYSFDGETVDGDAAELAVLGSLAGKSADEMYAGVATLQERDLIQVRAEWRAILPHAIANRLAKQALKRLPPSRIRPTLVEHASERLLRSFSRRLGYLDDSPEARTLVGEWLAPGGMLSDVASLSEDGRTILNNVAPVVPGAVLSAIEASLVTGGPAAISAVRHLIPLLRSLAYEPALFPTAVAILIKLAASTDEDGRNEAADVLESLFHIALSGTHAPIAMRLGVVSALLDAPVAAERKMGVRLLRALMETDNFVSNYEFDFGARSRDYGYYPATWAEQGEWFDAVLQLVTKHATSTGALGEEVRAALAQAFRGLWTRSGRAEGLDHLARAIAGTTFWRDGWIAARHTRTYDGKDLDDESRRHLTALEEFLRPKDIAARVRGLVIGPKAGGLDLNDFDDDDDDTTPPDAAERYAVRMARRAASLEELARDVVQDRSSLREILPEVISAQGKAYEFGEALAKAAEQPRELWDSARAAYAASADPSASLLAGLVRGLQQSDPGLVSRILNDALVDPSLGPVFPFLQISGELDAAGLARLHKALGRDIAPIRAYQNIAYGRAADNVSGPDFQELVGAIAGKPGGSPVALEIVAMRIHGDLTSGRSPDEGVRKAGRDLLADYEFRSRDGSTDREDHELDSVASISLAGSDGAPAARSLVRKLMTAHAGRVVSGYDYNDLIKALVKVQPQVVLDELFSGDEKSQASSVYLLKGIERRQNAIAEVADDVIVAWCNGDPTVRYPIAAAICALYHRPQERGASAWRPLVRLLLENAPDPTRVFSEIVRRLYPSTWSGSLASKLEERLRLLETIPIDNLSVLQPVMDSALQTMSGRIAAERASEQQEDRSQNARFE